MPIRVQKIKKPKNQAMIRNPIHSFNENKNKEQTNIVFSNAKKNDLSNNKQIRKDQATQLSTNHWFLTNQTHSNSKIREYSVAKKSQETKVKKKVTGRALKS
jgi:hypothetical protein